MDKRSEAAIKANQTRKANELERRVVETVERLRAMPTFTSPEKDYARRQAARFLVKYGGPTADMQGPRGDSARVLVRAGLEVIAADNGGSSIFDDFDRGILPAALARIPDGWEFYFGDIVDILPRCRTAFLDPCGPLYVDGPSAALVRAAVSQRIDAFAITVMLARVEGMGGGKDRSSDYYLALARTVLATDAPMYRVRKVLRYPGEASVPFAVFMLERRACTVVGCNRPESHVGLCQHHYDAQPHRKAKRKAYVQAKKEEFAAYQREYYPNWKANPTIAERQRKYHRDYDRVWKPANRDRTNAQRRARRADPDYRQHEMERDSLSRKRRLAAVSGTAAEAVSREKAA